MNTGKLQLVPKQEATADCLAIVIVGRISSAIFSSSSRFPATYSTRLQHLPFSDVIIAYGGLQFYVAMAGDWLVPLQVT